MLAGLALALLDDETYAKVPPDLPGEVGWLCLAAVLLILGWSWTRAESVRRSVLALEDPRMLAVMRIGFALMTIQCFWNLKPYWRLLWSDEGLFTMEVMRERIGRTSLSGWSPSDGFFDLWALAKFFWSKYSFFFLKGSPQFVEAYMYAFAGVLLLYAAGVWSRITGLLSVIMMCSVYNASALYLEGTDTVYRVFWFILVFARTGHAWSFDNWLRCRRLRKQGRLQEPGEPPSPGKEPIYRLVPAWPRYLMIAQLVGIYTQTGAVKTGSVWANGDALYYALNMDHFYRFEVYTQQISAVFGTNVFKVMTWVTHFWETYFGIAALGMFLKFGLDHRDEAWYRAIPRWRVWLGRGLLVAAYVVLWRIALAAYPYCFDLGKGTPQATIDARTAAGVDTINAVFLAVIPTLVLAWYLLGRFPLRLTHPRTIAGRLTIPGIRLDQGSVRRWLLGRRTWLGLGLCFHGILILFMNIGMFPFIMLMTYAAWITGEEFAAALRWLVTRLRRAPALARALPARLDVLWAPAQEHASIPLRGRRIPDALVLVFGAGFVGLVVWRALGTPTEIGFYTKCWAAGIVAVAVVLRFVGRRPASPELWQGGPALAYGTAGRTIALAFTLYHGASVALTLFPSYAVFNKWRGPARAVFSEWTAVTGTSQSWKMFAPNPPRANSFMKTVVVEADGDRWDLQNNSYSYRPFPWIWNDRMRKMHRRMIGKGKWYLKYWAEHFCREWLIERGEYPVRVEVRKIITRIPSPEQVATKGWYRPAELKATETAVETHRCPDPSTIPLYIKERHGLPITDADRAHDETEAARLAKAYDNRKTAWASRRDFGGPGPREVSAIERAIRRVQSALIREESMRRGAGASTRGPDMTSRLGRPDGAGGLAPPPRPQGPEEPPQPQGDDGDDRDE
ncbi:MAG: hypothetical protein R3B09_09800 [Nannocystaceae bacterium]